MDRFDDSGADSAELFRDHERAYLDLVRTTAGREPLLRDLIGLAAWEDYGLFERGEPFLEPRACPSVAVPTGGRHDRRPARAPILVVHGTLGAWLFISAFAWPHTAVQRGTALVVGLLCTAVAVATLFVPRARYLNTALSVWLLVSGFSSARSWHRRVCGAER
jgi:hypothetical protein